MSRAAARRQEAKLLALAARFPVALRDRMTKCAAFFSVFARETDWRQQRIHLRSVALWDKDDVDYLLSRVACDVRRLHSSLRSLDLAFRDPASPVRVTDTLFHCTNDFPYACILRSFVSVV